MRIQSVNNNNNQYKRTSNKNPAFGLNSVSYADGFIKVIDKHGTNKVAETIKSVLQNFEDTPGNIILDHFTDGWIKVKNAQTGIYDYSSLGNVSDTFKNVLYPEKYMGNTFHKNSKISLTKRARAQLFNAKTVTNYIAGDINNIINSVSNANAQHFTLDAVPAKTKKFFGIPYGKTEPSIRILCDGKEISNFVKGADSDFFTDLFLCVNNYAKSTQIDDFIKTVSD